MSNEINQYEISSKLYYQENDFVILSWYHHLPDKGKDSGFKPVIPEN
jgi:hypothetical protein